MGESWKQNFIILLLGGFIISATYAKGERPCNIAVRCSNEEQIVWATDGIDCTVWRNGCHLTNENCERQNRYEEVSKEECQMLCRDGCLPNYDPVCAWYNGVPRTFSNDCALAAHICRTGETYSLHTSGECEE